MLACFAAGVIVFGFQNLLALGPADCPSSDAAAIFGAVENQTGLGWCYAYTATDLLNFQFRQALNGRTFSPADLATKFNQKFLRNETARGGFIGLALEVAGEYGVCPRGDIEEQFQSEYPFSYVVAGFKNVKEDLEGRKDQNFRLGLLKKYRDEGFMPKILSAEELLQIFENTKADDIARKMFSVLCGPNKFVPAPVHVETIGNMVSAVLKNILGKDYIDVIKGSDYKLQKMSELLRAGQVVGISIKNDFLSDEVPKSKFLSSHSLTVVGQRWDKDTQSCEYHVRNSWGDDCSLYTPEVKKTCEKGYLWLSERVLKEKLLTLVWLK